MRSLFNYYKLSLSSKMKIAFIGAGAAWYYYYENYSKDTCIKGCECFKNIDKQPEFIEIIQKRNKEQQTTLAKRQQGVQRKNSRNS